MNKLIILFVFLLLTPIMVLSQKPFALVELFTSEGCSSCPPADELLSMIKRDAEKNNKNVITIAYHVDYWNRYGWKDPYSKRQYTIRQENYSRSLAEKEMYTPQAIVNGKVSFVGSDRKKMEKNIEKALEGVEEYNLKLSIDSISNDSIYGKYNFSMSSSNYSLRLALTEDGLTSKVGNGENAGKELHHDSVVRYYFSIDSPKKTGSFKLSNNVFTGKGDRHLVGFVQRKLSMSIVAVSVVDFR